MLKQLEKTEGRLYNMNRSQLSAAHTMYYLLKTLSNIGQRPGFQALKLPLKLAKII
jgi:hypothetical protein